MVYTESTQVHTKVHGMVYTLGTVAKATGKSKSTIAKAVRSGKIKATKTDSGYEIAPDELAKVYTLVHGEGVQVHTKSARVHSTPVHLEENQEIASLKAQLDAITAERDWLRKHAEQLTFAIVSSEQKLKRLEPTGELKQKLFGKKIS